MLSRWTDNTKKDIESILKNILDYRSWYNPEKDPLTKEDLAYHVDKEFNENKHISLNGNDIEYNLIKYDYEKVRPGAEDEEMRSSRIQSISGFVLIYTDGSYTQYITDRSGNSHTLTILRKLCNYTGKLEIENSSFRITEDLFTWMIYRVMNSSGQLLEDESHLLLKQIIGFKGSTRDKLAEITGTGNRILNQLSTLAFLFENKQVSYINTKVEYKHEQLEFSIDLRGNVGIDFETYSGNFIMTQEYETNSKVILMVFLEIIPKILSSYHLDKENNEWSENVKVDFFTNIGESISEQINKKLKRK